MAQTGGKDIVHQLVGQFLRPLAGRIGNYLGQMRTLCGIGRKDCRDLGAKGGFGNDARLRALTSQTTA